MDHTPSDKTAGVSKNWLIGVLVAMVAFGAMIGINDILSRLRAQETMGKENRERIVKVEELTIQFQSFDQHFQTIEKELTEFKVELAKHEASSK
jgi:hypothetical protein